MAGANLGFTTTDSDAPLIAKLSTRYQEALSWLGTDQEVADRLGMVLGTVKSRRNRARNALAAQREADADARNQEGAARHA